MHKECQKTSAPQIWSDADRSNGHGYVGARVKFFISVCIELLCCDARDQLTLLVARIDGKNT
jgi:hypothetical protein